jgi:hypothetical protein
MVSEGIGSISNNNNKESSIFLAWQKLNLLELKTEQLTTRTKSN